MLYHHLLHIIRAVKKSVPCPSCQRRFASDHIDVVDIYEQEGFLMAYCTACDVAVEITMTLQDEEPQFSHNYVDNYSKNFHVTEDDIAGVRTKLHSFKGELKDLFT